MFGAKSPFTAESCSFIDRLSEVSLRRPGSDMGQMQRRIQQTVHATEKWPVCRWFTMYLLKQVLLFQVFHGYGDFYTFHVLVLVQSLLGHHLSPWGFVLIHRFPTWWCPKFIHLSSIFHFKPSSYWGTPWLWKLPLSGFCHLQAISHAPKVGRVQMAVLVFSAVSAMTPLQCQCVAGVARGKLCCWRNIAICGCKWMFIRFRCGYIYYISYTNYI